MVETVRLDDMKLHDVGFIKIGVEAHGAKLQEGARMPSSTNWPVCLIECLDRSNRQVEEYFANLHVGYRQLDKRTRFGFELTPGNLLFGVE